MEKVVVIGSNSFSGSNFVNTVLENTEYDVIGISRSPEPNPIFLPYKKKDPSRFKFHCLDLNQDLDKIIELIKNEKAEYVVNYAAQGMVGESWNAPEQWFQTNCLAVVNLTDQLRKLDFLKKYIHISTNEVYGSCNNTYESSALNPSTPYASSKAAADMFILNLIKQFNFPADIVRSTNVYGAGQQLFRIIPRSIIYLKTNKKIPLHGGGTAKKSYLHIKDNCLATLKIMQSDSSGEIYHLSPDSGISIADIVRKICGMLGKSFDESVEITGERTGQDSEYTLNSSKTRNKFVWKPEKSFDEGISECINWVNENWNVINTLPQEYIHKI
ncbi:MAG: GDP-mannose 4,6-dehydratase [Nanoarchaeota archaeon]